MLRSLLKNGLWVFAHLMRKLLLDFKVTGLENVPKDGPLLIISNHFSLFEPPLVGMMLPQVPAYMVAKELQTHPVTRHMFYFLDLIPVWRGQVDRAALKLASQHLEGGGRMVIMPEGGILPEMMEAVGTGEQIHRLPFEETGRLSGELIEARPGAAFLATRQPVSVLPIAFLGTQHVARNMKRWRRTKVEMIVGRPFGPLTIPKELRGQARRDRLDELGNEMMRQLAALMPPEARGPYR